MVKFDAVYGKASNQQNKKILIVVRWPVGGIRNFLKYFLKFLPQCEMLEIHIIAIETEAILSLKDEVGHRVYSWFLVDTNSNRNLNLAFTKKVYGLVRSGEYDLIHAHGFTSAIVAGFSNWGLSTPLIVTSHDILKKEQFIGLVGLLKRKTLGWALESAYIIHSVSFDAERNLLDFYPNLKIKGKVILNGVDTEQFSKSHHGFSIGPQYNDRIVIGFFGRFMNQKGFRFLVQAINEIVKNNIFDGKVLVCCFGSGAFIREEQAQIHQMGLDAYFIFFPFLADISSAMRRCDLIVIPSLWEACPLLPMEALCSGVPIVASDCIGLREVLSGTPAILTKSSDPLSLMEGIVKCVNGGKQAFENYVPLAVARFDVKKSTNEICSIYNKVLE